MVLNILTIIGSIGFALSGAIVAIEEDYDIFGILVLGFVTAFAGGLIRNIIVGLPIEMFWHQNVAFSSAFIAMLVVIILPSRWMHLGFKPMLLFDAIGLSAFSVLAALYTQQISDSVITVMVASVMTGIGGGMIRDVLAQRKPMVLHSDIYAVWCLIAGLIVGLKLVNPNVGWQIYSLILVIFVLRMLSVFFNWKLPHLPKD